MDKTFEVFVDNGYGRYEFEGVFSSLKEVSQYMEIPKYLVTLIANADYAEVPAEYHGVVIDQVFGPEEFRHDIESLRKEITL